MLSPAGLCAAAAVAVVFQHVRTPPCRCCSEMVQHNCLMNSDGLGVVFVRAGCPSVLQTVHGCLDQETVHIIRLIFLP